MSQFKLLTNYYYKHPLEVCESIRASIIDEAKKPTVAMITMKGYASIGIGIASTDHKFPETLKLILTPDLVENGVSVSGYWVDKRNHNEIKFVLFNGGNRPVRIEDGDVIGSLGLIKLEILPLPIDTGD